MARELTSTQQSNVEAGATRPIYLVEWNHSGTVEYLSCSGDVLYGDGSPNQTYSAGGITIARLEDSKTATLILPATAARVAEIQNNTWRTGICKITAILAAPGDSPVYAAADGLLVLDGVIESSSFSGETVTVTAKSKYYTGALIPRFTYDDVVTSAPAVGTVSTWEGENYSYEQWLKTTAAIQRIVRPGVNPQVTGRQSVSQINSFEPIENTGQKLLTAQGVYIPVVYGRASVAGHVFAEGEFSGDKFIGVAWCMGEVYSIERVFINDAPVPSTVTAKHYRGTATQTVSPALQTYINSSPQFSDDMVLRTAAGDIGICYSVIRIPTSAISGAPRFRAIIQGRIVDDPASTAVDPFESSTEWSFNFLTGTADAGPNNYTLTLVGNAGIASPSAGLVLDGTGDYATIPDGTDIGSDPFSLEIEVICSTAVASPGTRETLISKGATASPLSLSLKIDRVGDSVLLYLSSDGATWDIANGLSCGTLATTGSPQVIGRILVERVDNQISTYMNGVTQAGVVTSSALFNSGSVWSIGASGGADEFTGTVRSARLTIGQYRYGSPHSITNTPFSDSGTYTAGVVYSENPALCWADLASDPVIGLGAATTGVQLAREYCDSPLQSGAARCRIGLAITESRLVEAWLDQLAMYANALWFPEGANLKIIPDKIKDGTNGSGKELYTATSPEVFGSPLPSVNTEDGASYSVSIEITTAATTSPITGVSVNLGGVEVIPVATTVGTHGGTITVSGTSNTVEVIEEAGFTGTWANLSVKRTHRLVTKWLPSSLSIQGAAEGDKPNAVEATYNIPSDTSGAWQQNTFPVINALAAAGEPIVITRLSLPGVNRIEEASNKAIATLYRNDKKTRVSLISTDEEFVAQPGDTIEVVSSYRGVDTPVFVESNQMVSYGRHQVSGIIYRDNQYPDTDYTTPRKFDGNGGPGDGPVEEPIGTPVCIYNCAALDATLALSGEFYSSDSNSANFVYPLSTNSDDWYCYSGGTPVVASWSGNSLVTQLAVSALGYSTAESLGFCDTPFYVTSFNGGASTTFVRYPNAVVGNYGASMVLCPPNGTGSIVGDIARNTGARYDVTGPFGSGSVYTESRLIIESNGAGGSQIRQTVSGGTSGDQTLDLGDVSGQWLFVAFQYVNSVTGTGPSDPFKFHHTVTGVVTTSAGPSFQFSWDDYVIHNSSTETYVLSAAHVSTSYPTAFVLGTGQNIACAGLQYNGSTEWVLADIERMAINFRKTFTGYSGPC